jgi:TOMM system kinase/cyclase fusion protein
VKPDTDREYSRGESIGPYRLEEPLGSGGMGTVWRAWDERLQRGVALKRFHAEGARVANLRERFRREARAVARLSHPAIVQLYDLLETEDGDWLVLELVRGRTLHERLATEGPLDPVSALRFGRDVAEALAEAHAHGVLHRDLKSANVMLTPRGQAKVLDFGIATAIPRGDGAPVEVTLSAPGTVLGTCHAMSPEQVLGEELDARSDLFSLGSLLFEAVTGTPPFLADSPTASIGRVLSFQPPPLHRLAPSAPRALSDLVDRLLAKEASGRPASAREVADTLAALAGEVSGNLANIANIELSAPPTLDLRPPAPPRPGTGGETLGQTQGRRMGERRTLTVVCCGLTGVDDAGAEGPLDLEALPDVLAELEDLAREACRWFGGRFGAVVGNVLWLYFGYPQAHEDDAQRAVRAAREIATHVETTGLRREPGARRRPAVRLGVHTGPAVVTARPGQEEQLQPGSTLDVATGLQAASPPGAVVVSAASRKLVAGDFATEALAAVRLPGSDEPVALHRVLAAADPQRRDSGAVHPLVGRAGELGLLLDRFRLARSGTGQAALISGEPGIGKTRLVRALQESIGKDGHWLVGQGSGLTHSSPLAPVIDLLEREIFPVMGEPASRKLEHLEELLRRYDLPLEESLPLLAALLSLPPSERYPAPALPPDVRRRRTHETLVALFGEMAERRPLVLVIEDLHWVDPSTLDLLKLLLDEIAGLRLMVVLTFRPGFEAPWGQRAHVLQLGLSRLTDSETEALIARVGEGRLLPDEVRRQIVARTDGVPLFIEELTKVVLESGAAATAADIPSTLSGSLMARLDRLGPAREVAQRASVIGRTFSIDLLAAVSELPPADLERGLEELLRAELVHRRGLAHRERYIFKHALIQDAAYASLLKRDRQRLHLDVARALESRVAEPEGAPPERIAHHYTAGEDFAKAADFWLEAGQRAVARFAHAEAIDHLRGGLRAAAALPPGSDRDRRELALQSALSVPVRVIQGYGAPEVGAIHARILELGERVGGIPQDVYFGLWSLYMSGGELPRARELARQLLRTAEEGRDFGTLLLALYTGAAADLFLGDPRAAAAGFERLLAQYPPGPPGPSGSADRPANDYDLGIVSLSLSGDAEWVLGRPDRARRILGEAIELAREGSPVTLSVALVEKLIVSTCMRERAESLACAVELQALSREHGYEYWEVHCDITFALLGDGDDALERAERALAAMRTVHGNSLQLTRFLAWTVQHCIDHGRDDDGRRLLEEAMALLERGGERYWEADLLRLQGLLAPSAEEAEACFQKALAVAREQGAAVLELRAATALARLWQGQGRAGEARDLLAGIYGAFTEGWTAPDLAAARELLEELTPGPGAGA